MIFVVDGPLTMSTKLIANFVPLWKRRKNSCYESLLSFKASLISFCWLPSRFWCVLWSTSIDAIIYFYGTFVWFSFGLIWHQIWFQYIDPFGLSIFKLGSQKSYAWNNIIWNSKNYLKHMDTSSKLHDFAPTSWIYSVNDVEVSVWTWKSCPRSEFGSFISFVSIPKHVHKFRIQSIFPYNLIMYHVSKGWLIILWMTTFSLAWRGWYVSMFYFCDNVRLVT